MQGKICQKCLRGFPERKRSSCGFTLAELLIALMILGEIATFTIPKVLVAQQNGSYNTAAKEVAGAISSAYQTYQFQNGAPPSTMTAADLTPYLNYVRVITTSYNIDNNYGSNLLNCSTTGPCVLLHNGGVLMTRSDRSFGGTAATNGIPFMFDPDGKQTDGTTNGPGKSIQFGLFYNGRLSTRDEGLGLVNSGGTWNSCGATPCNPPWFSWN